MSFNHTAEVILLMPVVVLAVLGPIGLLIMLVEKLTGWHVPRY